MLLGWINLIWAPQLPLSGDVIQHGTVLSRPQAELAHRYLSYCANQLEVQLFTDGIGDSGLARLGGEHELGQLRNLVARLEAVE